MACYVCGCAIEGHKDESGPCEECAPGDCIAFDEDEEDDEIEDQGGERYDASLEYGERLRVQLQALGFASRRAVLTFAGAVGAARAIEWLAKRVPPPEEGAPR